MQREIKFREWDKRNKSMCEPDAIIDGKGRYWDKHCTELWETDGILMQYTGLKDKNGVEIYEGDIVEYPQNFDFDIGNEFPKDKREIKYVEGYASFDVMGWFGGNKLGEYSNKIEVIGNIYEHKHLLGDE